MVKYVSRFEVAARHPDGRAFLIAYTDRNSHIDIYEAIRARRPAIARALEIAPDARFDLHRTPHPCWTHGEWTIGFTGRTKRHALRDGPLPSIDRPGADARHVDA